MSYCRPVGEIEQIKTDWIPGKLRNMYADYTLEEFILTIRNGDINSYLYDDSISEGEKMYMSDIVAEVLEFLIVNGFMRSEIMTLSTPEMYFVKEYIVSLEMIENYILGCESLYKNVKFDYKDYLKVFMPYYYSNRCYERYEFHCEKVEAAIDVLSDYLDDGELYDVTLDVMSVGNNISDEVMITAAKKKMVAKSLEILPELVEVFATF